MWIKAISAGMFFLATATAAQQPAADDRGRLGPALGAVLQADAAKARERLQALDGLSAPTERSRVCILGRLDPGQALPAPEASAAFSEKALYAYRLYWREAANHPDAREAAQTALEARLKTLIGRADLSDMQAIEAALAERIRAEGRYVLNGRTGLLRDMMIWSRQDESDVKVALPEGEHTTRLFLLRDFQSRGWAHWLTCNANGTGGWAKSEGLYAIAEVWNLEAEEFTASFLGHETQHFADYITFPGLPEKDLEYRAKLTEASLANETLAARLTSFERNQSDNEADSHSHANRRVLAALRARLGLPADGDLSAVPVETLHEAARQELFADTARRRAAAASATAT